MKKIMLLSLLIHVFACEAMEPKIATSLRSPLPKSDEFNFFLPEEMKRKIAAIFDIKDSGLSEKISISLENYIEFFSTLELFAAAQACNYKKLKELLFSDRRIYIPLNLLSKARSLAEGKEFIFRGVSRIFYADSDECIRLINLKITDEEDFFRSYMNAPEEEVFRIDMNALD